MTEPTGRCPEYVAAEYEAVQAAYLQYDGFRWASGGLLIAGAFVFLGFLANNETSQGTLAAGSLIITTVMSIWLLYAQHYRQLYLIKIDRLLELEDVMGAEQHRRWHSDRMVGKKPAKYYKSFGPAGHSLDRALYAFISLGGPLLAVAGGNFSVLLGIPIAIVPVVLFKVHRQDTKTQVWLKAHAKSGPQVEAEANTYPK